MDRQQGNRYCAEIWIFFSNFFLLGIQNIHGITPTAAKSMGSTLQAYPSIQFSITITGGFVADTSCTDIQRYGLQSVRRISKKCII